MKRFLNPKLILAFMAVALVVTMVATVVVFRSLPIPARAASNQMATIGMPFNGKWAYYQNVNPPYTDANSSHPTVHWTDASTHYLWGDWATDIYGATGVSVNLRVSGATGALSFGWFTTSSDKCGGSSRGVIIKVDNTEIGRLYVTHLQNPASMINAPTNGMKLGEVRDGTCNPGHHTHIELKSSVSNTKACYTDHGNPGKSLVEGDSLGIVGNSGATAIRTACSTSSSGGAYSRPAVLQYGTEMDVYKQGSNNDFWKNTWQPSNNSWSGWVDMTGASFQGDPAAIKYNSEMDVFGIGTNGQVYKNTWQPSNNSWSGWNILGSGGTFVGTPSAIQYGSSEMDVYARATNNQIYKETWNGTSWSGWNSLGGSIAGNPKAMIYNGSEMDVWARGTDGALWKDGWNGSSWGGFGSMGGSIVGDPAAIQYNSEMDVYANTPSGELFKRTWNGSSWSSWVGMPGVTFSGSPAALQYNTEMDVYARGVNDSHIYKQTWQPSNNSWSGWNSLGGNEAGDPTAIQYSTEMDVYATNYAYNTDKDTWLPNNNNWSGFTALL